MRFKLERSEQGFARNIIEDGKVIIHLNEGTVRNEENIERVVYLLNIANGALYNPDTRTVNLNPPVVNTSKSEG